MTERETMKEEKKTLAARMESVLFLHGEPVKKQRLAEILGVDGEAVGEAVATLRKRHDSEDSGLTVLEHDDAVEIATAPGNATTVEAFVSAEREATLGKATLETLSVIAYRGPVTRAEIDSIRGVNSSFALRALLLRGLIGREQNPLDTREYRYTASFRLLELLGVSSVADLPDYDSLSVDERLKTALDGDGSEPEDSGNGNPSSEPS